MLTKMSPSPIYNLMYKFDKNSDNYPNDVIITATTS